MKKKELSKLLTHIINENPALMGDVEAMLKLVEKMPGDTLDLRAFGGFFDSHPELREYFKDFLAKEEKTPGRVFPVHLTAPEVMPRISCREKMR